MDLKLHNFDLRGNTREFKTFLPKKLLNIGKDVKLSRFFVRCVAAHARYNNKQLSTA